MNPEALPGVNSSCEYLSVRPTHPKPNTNICPLCTGCRIRGNYQARWPNLWCFSSLIHPVWLTIYHDARQKKSQWGLKVFLCGQDCLWRLQEKNHQFNLISSLMGTNKCRLMRPEVAFFFFNTMNLFIKVFRNDAISQFNLPSYSTMIQTSSRGTDLKNMNWKHNCPLF